MSQNIEPINNPRDAISKELYDKCVDRLTGADKLLASLEGIMVTTSNPNPSPYDKLMSEIRLETGRFEPELYEWPAVFRYMASVSIPLRPKAPSSINFINSL